MTSPYPTKKEFKGAHIQEFNDPVKEILLALMLIAITELKEGDGVMPSLKSLNLKAPKSETQIGH